ncbi:MAG: MgtC/SapB family protein [Lachnospiraceae bacterium]|nr:MgtC/SapB family protein [Lachnospiraceae bacterium]
MTLFESLSSNYGFAENAEFILRIVIAAICGAAIGLERTRRFKEAGIRTHLIVCCGSALVMIVSKYGFADMTGADGSFILGTTGADPARVAAQVINGIGFLGAGVIFKQGASIKGLTTAAGLWVTAAIGLGIGTGMYVEAIITTVVVYILQFMFHKHVFGADSLSDYYLRFSVHETEDLRKALNGMLEKYERQISDKRIVRVNDRDVEYEITIRSDTSNAFNELQAFLDNNDDVFSVRATTVQQK